MIHTATNAAGATIFSAIATYVQSTRRKIALDARRSRAYRRTFDALSAMTDSDLADIGITRFMITDVAAEAAARA